MAAIVIFIITYIINNICYINYYILIATIIILIIIIIFSNNCHNNYHISQEEGTQTGY